MSHPDSTKIYTDDKSMGFAKKKALTKKISMSKDGVGDTTSRSKRMASVKSSKAPKYGLNEFSGNPRGEPMYGKIRTFAERQKAWSKAGDNTKGKNLNQ